MASFNLTAEPGKHEVVITSVLDAPRDLVFKVCMGQNLIPQWRGPRSFTTTV
jgi:uncharacterized protein YndB with AHSA1/START domain